MKGKLEEKSNVFKTSDYKGIKFLGESWKVCVCVCVHVKEF